MSVFGQSLGKSGNKLISLSTYHVVKMLTRKSKKAFLTPVSFAAKTAICNDNGQIWYRSIKCDLEWPQTKLAVPLCEEPFVEVC